MFNGFYFHLVNVKKKPTAKTKKQTIEGEKRNFFFG